MRIMFDNSVVGPGGDFRAGQVYEVADDVGAEYVRAGYAHKTTADPLTVHQVKPNTVASVEAPRARPAETPPETAAADPVGQQRAETAAGRAGKGRAAAKAKEKAKKGK